MVVLTKMMIEFQQSQFITLSDSKNYNSLISTMDNSEDPFAIFEAPQKRKAVENLEGDEQSSKKRFHQDPMAALEHQIYDQNQIIVESDEEMNQKKLENIEILSERNEEGCIHQVFFPKDYERTVYNGELSAKKYPWKLDPFQSKAIHAIQSDESVLVCAHTSAGKTAIAEYAIAKALQNNSRVIYTSPIKALSNQKYRELKQQFTDVGLVTGDVTIDQGSTCLVMTTQILRNMIYRGNEIVREVKWVIFDEVHYMRDKERGVVWEETIIMMPPSVKYVFLSATIGNPSQFALWITKLRKQPCNVVYTDYRPVPLEHYLCPAGGQGLYLVVDEKSNFNEENFSKAIQVLGEGGTVVGFDKKKKNNVSQGSDLSKIIKTIIQRNLDPVIVFSFSKKDVESYARAICTKYDLTTKAEKERIQEVYNNSLNVLDEVDRKMPAIMMMREIIKKGVGIHHGGLLPLVKEVIELLFQDGLIKVLFSTETFSMGLNMPARTVVFTNIKKFDGEKSRWLTGGEYIQMSGRAGRRGIDKKGTTILMLDEKMEPEVAKGMLKGKSDDLLSSFYLSYNMLLNSQRLEDIDVEYILARSLLQFQQDTKLPTLLAQHNEKLEKYKQLNFQEEEDMENLYLLNKKWKTDKESLRKIAYTAQRVLPFMNIGRIIHLVDGQIDWGYGVCVNFHKRDAAKRSKEQSTYLFDCMVYIKARSDNNSQPEPAKLEEEGQLVVISFALNCLYEITTLKISNLPNDLNSSTSKNLIFKTLKSLISKKLQTLSIDSNEAEAIKLKSSLSQIQEEIEKLKHLEPKLEEYIKKKSIYQQIRKSAKKLKEMSSLVLRKEKKAYSRVIKRAGLVEKGVVTLKGRVTCQINSNHQILLTELLFSGFFNDMEPEEIAAILSSLVHEERSSTERSKTKNVKLRLKLEEMIQKAKQIFHIFQECKVSIEEDEYLESIKEQLTEVTFDWCNGENFEIICKKTDTYEGSIVRTLRRLNEMLKGMVKAAAQIGNEDLMKKFEDAGGKVFRGIVFAASLYTL